MSEATPTKSEIPTEKSFTPISYVLLLTPFFHI